MAEAADTRPSGGGAFEKTVLFADIADSTGTLRELGEDAGRRLLMRCLDVMSAVVEESKGQVVDRIGDELFCLFDDPDSAAHAAAQLQQRVVDGHASGAFECPMRVRIGLEHGSITRAGTELYGTTIHAAKRLVDMAKAGQILTTHTTLQMMGPLRRRMERYFDSRVLKGMAEEQDIHELLWDTSVTMIPTGRKRPKRQAKNVAVELRYRDESIRVDASQPRVTLGRDAACQLRLDGSAVSRVHARIIWDRGKVRLEDISTNGTSIELEGGAPRPLHKEGAELEGEGTLRCGCLGREEDAALVAFRCVPCTAEG